MNHGLCINCWWYQLIQGRNYIITNHGLVEKLGCGRCYMHKSEEGDFTTVEGDSYCPDYYNRKRGNKEQKMTLEEWYNARKD